LAAVIAIDAGTTGVRALAFGETGDLLEVAYREIGQHYPGPGLVEQDPAEIWSKCLETLLEVSSRLEGNHAISAIGVTNQRETVVAFDRDTGEPLHRAIVWQDRRTASACEALKEAGLEPRVRELTGLLLDPYFSATKMSWLMSEGGLRDTPSLCLGTVDSWVVWNLTGGLRGGSFVTDPSNASRTMLYDVASMTWSEELAERFAVPLRALPEVVSSSGRIGLVSRELAPAGHPLHGVAVGGIAGDQQAALFGQACFEPGMAKATYGTGAFVLVNAGDAPPSPREGLLGTVAWDLGTKGGVAYALEGSVFQAGGTIQWLRDGLGVIEEASEVGPLAASLDGNDGVYLVPAFSGLGSPWWDPYARSLVVGLTRGTGRAHLARAALEAIAYQTRDVLDAMSTAGAPLLRTLRVDGGVAVVDLLLQIQADQAQVQVARPRTSETTALGAAMLAGLGVGLWSSLEEVSALWRQDASFEPKVSKEEADARHAEWLRALERSRAWAS